MALENKANMFLPEPCPLPLFAADTFLPAIATVPESGDRRIPAIVRKVLFPEPDGPTMAISSPRFTFIGSTWDIFNMEIRLLTMEIKINATVTRQALPLSK